MKERTLALAGVVQAAELVRQASWHGTWSGFAATASLQSLFKLQADNVDDIFGTHKNLRLGLETLVATLHGDRRYADTMRYAIGLLQVEKRFVRSPALQAKIGEHLPQIAAHGADLAAHEREDFQAQEIAELYAATISSLSPRIVVNGRAQYLKPPRTVHWIRTLLLAGLRSAVLWQQLGGNRFELLFRRRHIMREAEALLFG